MFVRCNELHGGGGTGLVTVAVLVVIVIQAVVWYAYAAAEG